MVVLSTIVLLSILRGILIGEDVFVKACQGYDIVLFHWNTISRNGPQKDCRTISRRTNWRSIWLYYFVQQVLKVYLRHIGSVWIRPEIRIVCYWGWNDARVADMLWKICGEVHLGRHKHRLVCSWFLRNVYCKVFFCLLFLFVCRHWFRIQSSCKSFPSKLCRFIGRLLRVGLHLSSSFLFSELFLSQFRPHLAWDFWVVIGRLRFG